MKYKNYLGEGILIGLLYGLAVLCAPFTDISWLFTVGIIFFCFIAFYWHNKVLYQIKQEAGE